MKNITQSIVLLAALLLAVLSSACTVHTAEPVDLSKTQDTAAPLSCDLAAESNVERVLKFSDPDTAAPGGTACLSLGGGYFTCPADFCLELPYAGTCPHCGGGGE